MSNSSCIAASLRVAGLLIGFVCFSSASVPVLHAQEADPDSEPAPWWQRISLSGDFRGRYEGFYQEGRETRHRERFRVRISMDTPISDEVDFGVRIASGDPGNPGSTNQTFGDTLGRKALNIDRVFVAYTPEGADFLTLGGGKFGYPLIRTQMLWDDDVNWEGTYQRVSIGGSRPATLGLAAAQSPINEVSRGEDSFLFAEAAQVDVEVGRHSLFLALAGYAFRNVDQVAIAYTTDELRTHNTNLLRRDAGGNVVGFLSGFNLIDAIAGATFATGDAEYPASVLVDWVTNTRAATEEDTGVWIETEYGRARKPRTVAVSYVFARIAQEAVLSPFNYSDMPGSNLWLHMPGVSFAAKSGVNFDMDAIISKTLRSPTPDLERWLTRVHVAVRLSF